MFKDPKVFGNKFDAFIGEAHAKVAHMVISGKIDASGYVNDGTLNELWSYVYHLFYSNKDSHPFSQMKTLRGHSASARNFYKTVHDYTKTDGFIHRETLVAFINGVIREHHPINPIVSSTSKSVPATVSRSNSSRTSLATAASAIATASDVSSRRSSNFARQIADYERKLAEAQLQTDELLALREAVRRMIKADTTDVGELIRVLHERLERPRQSSAKAVDCVADVQAFQANSDEMLNTVIFSKMCLIKFLSEIVGVDANVECAAPEDLTKQRRLFGELTKAKQDHYRQMLVQDSLGLLALKDLLLESKTLAKTDCQGLNRLKAENARLTAELPGILSRLINLNEDLLGSVRVFLKMRKFLPKMDNENTRIHFSVQDNQVATIECGGQKTSARFFGVFDEHYRNLDMVSGHLNTLQRNMKIQDDGRPAAPWSLINTFYQLQDGYSICLLTTGYSGSGKSYGFFGSEGAELGIVHYGLANLNATKISIEYVFELYYDQVDVLAQRLQNKILIGYDGPKNLAELLRRAGAGNVSQDPIMLTNPVTTDVTKIDRFLNANMKIITDHQRTRGRIKRTMNNDESSRSHLFVVIKVNDSSYLTLCDLAGFENAMSIYKTVFTDKMTLPYFLMQFDSDGKYKGNQALSISQVVRPSFGIYNDTDMLSKKAPVGKIEFIRSPPKIEDTVQKNVQVVMESFFVVESLLHMRWYFNMKSGKDEAFKTQKLSSKPDMDYSTERVFVQPKSDQTGSKINMLPILKFIDHLGKQDTVSKFVLYGAIRPDRCADNLETFRFLASVTS